MSSQTGTVSSTTGSSGWTNPNNIFTSNNGYAVSGSITNSSVTGFIYALGNGFSIPSGATIDGVEVSVEGKCQYSGSAFTIRASSSEIRLVYSGSDISSLPPTGVSNVAFTTTTDATKTLGSPTTLWGAALTDTIVNDASFGVRFRLYNSLATTQTFSIDRVSITVYYTDSAGVQSSQQLFMYEG